MKTKNRLRALTGAITDIVLAAVILLVFAYFHHGRMYLLGRGFVEAPAATAQPTAAAAAQPEGRAGRGGYGAPHTAEVPQRSKGRRPRVGAEGCKRALPRGERPSAPGTRGRALPQQHPRVWGRSPAAWAHQRPGARRQPGRDRAAGPLHRGARLARGFRYGFQISPSSAYRSAMYSTMACSMVSAVTSGHSRSSIPWAAAWQSAHSVMRLWGWFVPPWPRVMMW